MQLTPGLTTLWFENMICMIPALLFVEACFMAEHMCLSVCKWFMYT